MTVPRYIGATILVILLAALVAFPFLPDSTEANVFTCGTLTMQGTSDEARAFEEESGLTCEGEERYIPEDCGYEITEECPIRFPNL